VYVSRTGAEKGLPHAENPKEWGMACAPLRRHGPAQAPRAGRALSHAEAAISARPAKRFEPIRCSAPTDPSGAELGSARFVNVQVRSPGRPSGEERFEE